MSHLTPVQISSPASFGPQLASSSSPCHQAKVETPESLPESKKRKNFLSLFFGQTPINFWDLFGNEKTKAQFAEPSNQQKPTTKPQTNKRKRKEDKSTPQQGQKKEQKEDMPRKPRQPQQKSHAEQQAQLGVLVRLAPQFENPPTNNNCWFNAVLQVVIHSMRMKGNFAPSFHPPMRQEFEHYGRFIYPEIQKFKNVPGQYSVNSLVSSQSPFSLKQMMLFSMGLSLNEIHGQHDAAECISALLRITTEFSFLWHLQDKILKCENCHLSETKTEPETVAIVPVSNFINRGKIDARGAILNFFSSSETVERHCTNCFTDRSTKKTELPTPSKFIIVQLLRFTMAPNQTAQKITNEVKPFSSLEIETSAHGSCNYHIIATVEHIGRSPTGGHYVAYIKHHNGWLKCNDKELSYPNDNDPIRNAYLVVLQTNEVDDE